jgi:hypothetical protein
MTKAEKKERIYSGPNGQWAWVHKSWTKNISSAIVYLSKTMKRRSGRVRKEFQWLHCTVKSRETVIMLQVEEAQVAVAASCEGAYPGQTLQLLRTESLLERVGVLRSGVTARTHAVVTQQWVQGVLIGCSVVTVKALTCFVTEGVSGSGSGCSSGSGRGWVSGAVSE